MTTNLHQTFKAQVPQILQLQNETTSVKTQVLEHGKIQEYLHMETMVNKGHMVTLQATVDGLCREQGKMKDNERTENEIFNKQIAVLKGDVTQLREEKFL